MNNILAALGALLVLVLGALFAVPHFIDWNQYRGVIEEEASRIIGRDLRIGANVKLRLLPTPMIRLEDVRVADTAATTGEPIFRTEYVSTKLAISPLLRGVLEASEIELHNPVLRLVLDQSGGGNWQSLGVSGSGLNYLPSNISLSSILITNGRVQVIAADEQRERMTFNAINGELAAQALNGPFRFKGSVDAGGRAHEVRGQISEADSQATRRVSLSSKAVVGSLATRIEGRLASNAGLPNFKGDAVVTLPATPAAGAAPAELKAAVNADTRGADFTDVTVTFDAGGRPQALTGSGKISWIGETDASGALAAKWLNIDDLIGFKAGAKDNPVSALIRFAGGLPLWTRAGGGKRAFKLSVEQATVGGEAVGNVELNVDGVGGLTRIEEFRATVPGAGRIEVSGRLVEQADQSSRFAGMAMMRAGSGHKLVGWLSGGQIALDQQFDGPMVFSGNIATAASTITVRQMSGTMGASAFEGEVDYTWGEKPLARVALSGPAVDIRALQGSGEKSLSLVSMIDQLADGLSTRGKTDLVLRLRAGVLQMTQRSFQNVSADLSVIGPALDIRRLDATAEDGASVALSGKILRTSADPGRRLPAHLDGQLRGAVTAPDVTALKTLFELGGLPDSWRSKLGNLKHSLPLAMAGSVEFGHGAGNTAIHLVADGTAGSVKARLDGALDATGALWTSQPGDLTVTLESDAAAPLDGVLGDLGRALWSNTDAAGAGDAAKATMSGQGRNRRIVLRASGVPKDGLVVLMQHESSGGTLTFNGQATTVDTRPQLAGTVTVAADDGAQALSPLAMLPANVLAGIPVRGRAQATLADGKLQFRDIAAVVGDTDVQGSLSFTSQARSAQSGKAPIAAPIEMNGTVSLSRLDVRTFIQLATGAAQRAGQSGSAGISVALGRSGVWSDRPFDFSLTDQVIGNVAYTAARLDLPDGLAANDARGELHLSAGRIELRDATASALGGKWTIAATLEKAAGGASLTGALRLDQGRFDSLGGNGAVAGQGSLQGVGVSPAGLVSALSGSGAIDIGPTASVTGLSAKALRGIIERALAVGPESMAATLKSGLAAPEAFQPVTPGARKIAFEINSGLARLKPAVVESADGRVLIGGRLDLATLMVSSDWQTDSKLPPPPPIPVPAGLPTLPPIPHKVTAPLPPVLISSTQPLATLGRAGAKRDQQMQVSELERELAVRKVERDLETLERLRQIDEELAKLRERQRLDEIARRDAELRAQAEAAAAASLPAPAQLTAPSLPQPSPPPSPTTETPATQGSSGQPVAPATQPPAISGANDPAARPAQKPPAPKASSTGIRPLPDEERRRIFNNGGG